MHIKRKILVTDHDADLRTTLAAQIALHTEFEVSQASNASEAINHIKESPPDLVIMDVGLLDMQGRDVIQLIRREGYGGAIIILSADSAKVEAAIGLDSGVNDYVSKPFRFAVLLARVRSHLRIYDASDGAVLKIGEYSFNPSSKQLTRLAGASLRLTEKEAAILKFLYRANATIVTREVLLRELWGYNSSVTTHTLETHIYRLRQKIERDPANAQILLTDGGGYKLVP